MYVLRDNTCSHNHNQLRHEKPKDGSNQDRNLRGTRGNVRRAAGTEKLISQRLPQSASPDPSPEQFDHLPLVQPLHTLMSFHFMECHLPERRKRRVLQLLLLLQPLRWRQQSASCWTGTHDARQRDAVLPEKTCIPAAWIPSLRVR